MTRIETIFGGFLVVVVLAVVGFVFFGPGPSGSASASPDARRTSSFVNTSVSDLLDETGEDYRTPSEPCGCYSLGYDMVRAGLDIEEPVFEGQVQACYDRVGPMGAEALSDGAMAAAAVPRGRKSCRPGDYVQR